MSEERGIMDTIASSSLTRYVGLFAGYILYILIGSSIFDAIEMPAIQSREQLLAERKREFLQDNPSLDQDDLQAYISDIFDIFGHNNVTRPNFATWIFFSATLLTTIGYGQVPPLSNGSKMFAICYCTLGVPFTLILLKAITEMLLQLTSEFLEYLNTKLGHLYQPIQIRSFHAAMITSACVLIVFLLPAAIFSGLEPGWTFLDSFYYSYMSVTTIGVIDTLPASRVQNPEAEAAYKICVLIYLFLGLCFTLLCLSIINEIPQINFLLRFLHPAHRNSTSRGNRKPERMSTEKTNLVVTKTIRNNKYTDPESNFSRNTSISFSSNEDDR